VFAWAASALLAQSSVFDRPPAGVEDALRARVAKFYQAFVDGKFRQADEVVAEDSKDEFFAANKRRFEAFQIEQVVFQDNFTKARVVTLLSTEMGTFSGPMKVKAPQTTLWKLENGAWCWYVFHGARDMVDTPFGQVPKPKPEDTKSGPPPAAPSFNMKNLSRAVQPDRREVQFDPRKPATERVTVKNLASGPVSLGLRPVTAPGLAAKLDRREIGANQSAELVISYTPGEHPLRDPVRIDILAFPLDVLVPVQVKFVESPAGK
jgi:hypothetical protein